MNFWHNLRFALRLLRKSPAFTITVLATLGLCIGANTAIYSIVDAVFFRPLPYPQQDRLVLIGRKVSGNGIENLEIGQNGQVWELVRNGASEISPAVYEDGSSGVNLFYQGRTAYAQQQSVGANFFSVLGVHPLLGRTWTRAEDRPGGPNLVVLSDSAWHRFFDGQPSALGHTVDLRGAPFTVIGVMPRGFRTDVKADLWTPLQPSTSGHGAGYNYQIIGRLKPGVPLAAASSQLTSTLASYWKDKHLRRPYRVEEVAVPLLTGTATGYQLTEKVRLMLAAVALVLLIGCLNIAGLLLSRSVSRRREIVTRIALGASRAVVVRQLLTESLVLAVGGGLLGLFFGQIALQGLTYVSGQQFDIWNPVRFDWRIGFVSFGVALLSGLIFGLFPALQATSIDLRGELNQGGRGAAGNRRSWSRQALVFAEVAFGVTLVVGAGLLIRTLTGLMNLDPGFVPQNLTAATVSLDDARYNTTAAGTRLFRETLDRIRQIPGVESAAVTLNLPFGSQLNGNLDRIMGSNGSKPLHAALVNQNYATPQLFKTLRVPLLQGRLLTDADGPNSQAVTVVNDAFVRHFLPNDPHPVGARVYSSPSDPGVTIVGIVKSVVQQNGFGGRFGPVAYLPQMYVPVAQMPNGAFSSFNSYFSPSFVVRTRGRIAGLDKAMSKAIAAVDPRLPFSKFQDMNDILSDSLGEQRYMAVLFSTLGALALLLSAIGVYGLIAQSVAQRTREMGIRLALGATTNGIIRQAAAPGLILALAGVACGLVLSYFTARLLTSLIYGISATDPFTFVTVAALLILVAGLASILPALRLARLDPAQTLREE